MAIFEFCYVCFALSSLPISLARTMMAAGRKARPLPRPSSMFWSVIVVSAIMAKMSRGLNTTEKWTVATITDHTKRVRNTAKIRPVPTKQLKILKQNKNLKFLQSKAYEIVLL